MKTRTALAAITAASSLLAGAQNAQEKPPTDPALAASQTFNKPDKNPTTEVTVVLDAVRPEAQKMPVLVTGTPPADSETSSDGPEAATSSPGEYPPGPQAGLTIRIEKLQTVKGTVDPATIRWLAPFPAKPLAPQPVGWHLEASESAPPFTRKVELSPGAEVTLSVRPHLLVPDADGQDVFTIAEPGYEAALGYQQTATVGAVLSNSIQQLENDSKRLDTAIASLQQLLTSLPKLEPQPVAAPAPTPNRKR